MTATAIMFTGSGFALAADGNQLFGEPPNFIPDMSIGESNCAQKIFGAEGRDYALAYIMRGKIATEHRTFDASIEMQQEMASLSAQRFRTPRELVAVASGGLYRRMRKAILILIGDERVSNRFRLASPPSLENAVNATQAYIDICSSGLGLVKGAILLS